MGAERTDYISRERDGEESSIMEAGLIDKKGKTIATVSVDGTNNIDTAAVAAALDNIPLAPVPTVCRHAPKPKGDNTAYQTEAQMETSLIFQLELNGIRYEAGITNEEALIANFRSCIESFNDMSFTDSEWERFLNLIKGYKGVQAKTRLFQEECVVAFKLDDGRDANIRLVDKYNPLRNKLQVIYQYRAEGGKRRNRYDVTILMNGIPVLQIELKRRGVSIKEAFNQIERYQNESYGTDTGLFDFIQIFVISNGTNTRYYANTARLDKTGNRRTRRAGSFKQVNRWSDAQNNPIDDIEAFAASFLSPTTLKMVLTRYCQLCVNGKFIVLRPYQICAIEECLKRITAMENADAWGGKINFGGYIWHTTGSGKTLTTFRLVQIIAKYCPDIDKAILIVDRKDLDYQTICEFNKFAKDSVNATRNTKTLAKQLASDREEDKVIVTTIQKMDSYLKSSKHRDAEAIGKKVAILFDECHRSQFGSMHKLISDNFKRSIMFGFTGTPILAENAKSGGDPTRRTTEQLFGKCRHKYTVANAIDDGNVLPFRIDYIKTMEESEQSKRSNEKVRGIDTASALEAPKRIEKNSRYILSHFNQKTMRNRRLVSDDGLSYRNGFVAMLACQSISMAKRYYSVLKKLNGTGDYPKLKIGIIYSDAPNTGIDEAGFIDDEDLDASCLASSDRDFLQGALDDYNKMFATTYSLDGEGFDNYYKDISKRMHGEGNNGSLMPQDQCLDLLIVVNMFLTGFDSRILNTMFIDKPLRMHGLVQTFSRTNRIWNEIKNYGNIISFQTPEERVEEAFSLFGDDEANGKVLLKPYEEYLDEYIKNANELIDRYPIGGRLEGEQAKKDFISTFNSVMRTLNILVSFDEFASFRYSSADPLTERSFQDYKGRYLDLRADMMRQAEADKEPIGNDIVFLTELIASTDVNVDYIIKCVEEHRANGKNDPDFIDNVVRKARTSPSLRDKSELIRKFLNRTCSAGASSGDTGDDGEAVKLAWLKTLSAEMNAEFEKIVKGDRIDRAKTLSLLSRAFSERSGIPAGGTEIASLITGVSRFGAGGDMRTEAKDRAYRDLNEFYGKYITVATEYPITIPEK